MVDNAEKLVFPELISSFCIKIVLNLGLCSFQRNTIVDFNFIIVNIQHISHNTF